MDVAIRTDASVEIGSGHVMRCLALATALRQEGATVRFVCREMPGDLCHLIADSGFPLLRLAPLGAQWDAQALPMASHHFQESDAQETRVSLERDGGRLDWLVVDHYGLDLKWERLMRPFAEKILAIDDLASRPHDCDALLDQNLVENYRQRYAGLVPPHCLMLLGPTYALLREEFFAARRALRPRNGQVRRALIFMGGSDPGNETCRVLGAFSRLDRPDIALDVVVGQSNPHRETVRTTCDGLPNAVFHCQVDCMAALMTAADLAVGAGGSTTWERCFLGLPALVTTIADNQVETTAMAARLGALWDLGRSSELTKQGLVNALQGALSAPKQLLEMSRRALDLMGAGRGGSVASWLGPAMRGEHAQVG